VVKKNSVASKLTGDDTPATAETLKILLTFNADAELKALHRLQRVV
jgi:hypothetical protein